jgi:hypothetical protein
VALSRRESRSADRDFSRGGGGTKYPHQAVGILRPRRDLVWTTSGKSVGSGGHFMRVRLSWPIVDDFVAGGYTALKDSSGILEIHPKTGVSVLR